VAALPSLLSRRGSVRATVAHDGRTVKLPEGYIAQMIPKLVIRLHLKPLQAAEPPSSSKPQLWKTWRLLHLVRRATTM